MQVASTNFAKTLVCKREYDVILWRHHQRISSNNDHHTPLFNTRIWRGAYNQAVTPGITRPLHATGKICPFCRSALNHGKEVSRPHRTIQWRIQTRRFWGGAVKLGVAKNVFTCLNTKGCLRQSLCVAQKRLSFVHQKVAVLLVELCYFSGNNDSFSGK